MILNPKVEGSNPSAVLKLFAIQVLNMYCVGCEIHCSLLNTVSFYKMTHGLNVPHGVENVHTLCAGKPESDDRNNKCKALRDIADLLSAILTQNIIIILMFNF